MRIPPASRVLTCSAAATAGAQEKQSVEIGSSLGVTIFTRSGSTVTAIGAPAAFGPAAQPSVYATIFATPSVTIEPQLGLTHVSGSGSSLTMLDLGTQVG